MHGDLYDYSKVQYINSQTKVLIIDPEFGEFWQTPCSHLIGHQNLNRTLMNQKIGYINIIFDNNLPIGLKYGIETIIGLRAIQQNGTSAFDVVRIKTYLFETADNCRSAELECKKLFQKENMKTHKTKGIFTKKELPDGYTETTTIKNLDKIIEIYTKWGGVEIINHSNTEDKAA